MSIYQFLQEANPKSNTEAIVKYNGNTRFTIANESDGWTEYFLSNHQGIQMTHVTCNDFKTLIAVVRDSSPDMLDQLLEQYSAKVVTNT